MQATIVASSLASLILAAAYYSAGASATLKKARIEHIHEFVMPNMEWLAKIEKDMKNSTNISQYDPSQCQNGICRVSALTSSIGDAYLGNQVSLEDHRKLIPILLSIKSMLPIVWADPGMMNTVTKKVGSFFKRFIGHNNNNSLNVSGNNQSQ